MDCDKKKKLFRALKNGLKFKCRETKEEKPDDYIPGAADAVSLPFEISQDKKPYFLA